MDNFPHKIPASLITFALIIGILISDYYFDYAAVALPILIASTIVMYALFALVFPKKLFRYSIQSIVLLITIILIGIVNTHIFGLKNREVTEPPQSEISFAGFVADKTERNNNRVQYLVKVGYCKCFKELQNSSVLIYSTVDTTKNILLGDELIITGKIRCLSDPLNPKQFNYKNYLAKKGVNYTLFSESTNITKTGNNIFTISAFGNYVREKIIENFASYNVSANSVALFASFALGDKSLLDQDSRENFKNAGVMHVLAISGLHVGIVFLILNFIISLIPPLRRSMISALIIIIALWIYAIITGLSPSVQRAAFMFTVICLGNVFSRKGNIYNSVFISAFILLLIAPDLITDVGFQLSYVAVIGIVFFQPKLSGLWKPKYRVIKWFWDLTTVGIAASIATTPLSVYYFNQMPNYFLISNITIIPIAIGSLFIAVAFIALCKVPFIGLWLAKLLDIGLGLFNYVTEFVATLPHSTSKNLYLSTTELITIYITIIAVMFFLIQRTFSRLALIIISISAFLIIGIYDIRNNNKINNLIVYSTPPYSAIGFKCGDKHLLQHTIPDTLFDSKFQNNIKPYITWQRAKSIMLDSITNSNYAEYLYKSSHYITVYGKRIIILDESFNIISKWVSAIETDYLILTDKFDKDIFETINGIKTKCLILDSSIPLFKAERIKKELSNVDINIYVVQQNGAFIANFED